MPVTPTDSDLPVTPGEETPLRTPYHTAPTTQVQTVQPSNRPTLDISFTSPTPAPKIRDPSDDDDNSPVQPLHDVGPHAVYRQKMEALREDLASEPEARVLAPVAAAALVGGNYSVSAEIFAREAYDELEGALRSEPNRVQHAVEVVDMLGQALSQSVEVLLVGHVELDHLRRCGQPPGDGLGDLHGASERGQHDLGALLLRDLRDMEGDRAVHEDARDEELLAFENAHVSTFIAGTLEALDAVVEALGLEGVRACDDDDVGAELLAGDNAGFDALDVSFYIYDLLPGEMSATLVHDLVFDVKACYTG